MKLIALVDRNWGIAKDGKQICTIPADLKRFRELTMGGTVIMGRKTFEVIGSALPGRRNIVISKTLFSGDRVEVTPVFLDLWPFTGNLWVIGGESVYRQLLPYCDHAYITAIDADLNADQFCPNLEADDNWVLLCQEELMEYSGLRYQFIEYRRK